MIFLALILVGLVSPLVAIQLYRIGYLTEEVYVDLTLIISILVLMATSLSWVVIRVLSIFAVGV